ncbi:hypothetical protein C8R43DRAFT_1123442 [Mycena crocata]|nr:hypothetical protein C8R43DRAFT_1123442 [Mycena crocata]
MSGGKTGRDEGKNPNLISSRKKRKGTTSESVPVPISTSKRSWWEDWAAEDEQRKVYDPTLDVVDRFRLAAADFQKYRKVTNQKHLQKLWDQFKNFAGLRVPPVGKPKPVVDTGEMIFLGLMILYKTTTFLNDPARSVQAFLSSYMREHGLIWDKSNLVSAPHLLRFFIRFLNYNTALPEYADGLKAALDAVDVAAIELPLIPVISNTLPDVFSGACQREWGRKVDGFMMEDSDGDNSESTTKCANLDHSPTPAARSETQAGEESIEEIWTEGAAALRVPAAIAPITNILEVTSDGAVGWGGGGWGSDSWGETSDAGATLPVLPCAKATSTLHDLLVIPSLITLLGPTALPLTHMPGIVECSVRRVKTLTPPSSTPTSPLQLPMDDAPGAATEAVECLLAARMWRAVLSPWLDWDGHGDESDSAASAPRILRSSRGALATDAIRDKAPLPSTPKPHNMLTQDITVLLEAAAAEKLCIGMGLGATWVQLAQVRDLEPESRTSSSPKSTAAKKKMTLTKAEKKLRRLRYWYIDELIIILPSYWTV